MSVEVGRRVFVGSMAAGLPLLAGGGATLALAQRPNGPARIKDPVIDQVLADMKGAVRSLSRASSGEQTRRLASSLRVLAAWGASQQFDARVKDTVRRVIAREGRQAFLRRDVDRTMFRAEARGFGFDARSNVPVPVPPVIDDATRQKLLDDLLANGVTARWRQVADTLDAAATVLDRQAAMRASGAMLVAQPDPSICRMIEQEQHNLSVLMIWWCAPWFWWIPEPCGLTSAAYLGVEAVRWWYQC